MVVLVNIKKTNNMNLIEIDVIEVAGLVPALRA